MFKRVILAASLLLTVTGAFVSIKAPLSAKSKLYSAANDDDSTQSRRRFMSIATSSVAAVSFVFLPADDAAADETTRDIFRSNKVLERRAARGTAVAEIPKVAPKVNSKVAPKVAQKAAAKVDKKEELEAIRKQEEEDERLRLVAEAEAEAKRPPEKPRLLVLGGTGLIGKQVRKDLKKYGFFVIATSRDGRDDTIALDVLKPKVNVVNEVMNLAKENKCTGVVSCIGVVGTESDGKVNGANGLAAIGAKKAPFVKNFVAFSIPPEVRKAVKKDKALTEYLSGKDFSDEAIKMNFGGSGYSFTIIEPGAVGKNKPVAKGGKPIPLETISAAAVVGALGLEGSVLDTVDKIKQAASRLDEARQLA